MRAWLPILALGLSGCMTQAPVVSDNERLAAEALTRAFFGRSNSYSDAALDALTGCVITNASPDEIRNIVAAKTPGTVAIAVNGAANKPETRRCIGDIKVPLS
ncbi:hypothetical protein [Nereida sp. MMG025]|uniref:hypothetical protein n=1 Tax=Nereida sp. MMG025 TaxID=2909981 RepID=UPI001F35BAA5|nr:hypothetical protein [Nereida sp. MMG025]MCF6445505.1 hypothetical protein [Nereida sp. MMG025]